jgi:GNAT superfamily N-acetyltransferase
LTSIVTETLGPADFADWEPLWQGYLTFYKSQVSDDTTATTFQRLTGGSEPMGGFLARDEAGRAIGMVHWIDHRSCWTIGDYCYLQDLFVAPDVRGSGAGRLLMETVAAAAQARGCSRVHWLTQFENETAMLLYDRVAKKSGFLQYVLAL